MGDRSPCQRIMLDSQHPLPASRDQAASARHDTSSLWQVIRDLRICHAAYGLKSRHVAVLSTMVGFLKNQRHTMVFASNLALQERLNQVSERTLQRAVKDLVDAEMITRRDSPNRKRFALRRRDSSDAIAFGFDLSPLLDRANEIHFLADEIVREDRNKQILRLKLRALAASLEARDPDDVRIAEIRLIVRRKLGSQELEQRLETYLATAGAPVEAPCPTIELTRRETSLSATNLTVNDSQIDGHIQKSEKDDLDKKPREFLTDAPADALNRNEAKMPSPNALLSEIHVACPDVVAMSLTPNPSWQDLVDQAPCMASWMGIDSALMQRLVDQHGSDKAAVTVYCLLQSQGCIKRPGAYLRSLVTGQHAQRFDPLRWLRRLSTAVDEMAVPSFA